MNDDDNVLMYYCIYSILQRMFNKKRQQCACNLAEVQKESGLGCKLVWVAAQRCRESEKGREREFEEERQYVFRTGWLTVGFRGRYQRALDQKRGREKERERCRSAESVCNLCATDDFPSSRLTRFSLERQWDVTVNQRDDDDSKTHQLSQTECELDGTEMIETGELWTIKRDLFSLACAKRLETRSRRNFRTSAAHVSSVLWIFGFPFYVWRFEPWMSSDPPLDLWPLSELFGKTRQLNATPDWQVGEDGVRPSLRINVHLLILDMGLKCANNFIFYLWNSWNRCHYFFQFLTWANLVNIKSINVRFSQNLLYMIYIDFMYKKQQVTKNDHTSQNQLRHFLR